MRSRKVVGCVVMALQLMSSGAFLAQESSDAHVRAHSALARRLIADGSQRSALFRALVERLDRSDVVVYVDLDMRMSDKTRGRLRFIGSAGGRRYVDVRVARALDHRIEMSFLGHELQHAVEIAEAPEVVDARSMDRFYRRIGFSISDRHWHESRAAMETGRAIFREVADAATAVVAEDQGRR